jgi:hypothetical protein
MTLDTDLLAEVEAASTPAKLCCTVTLALAKLDTTTADTFAVLFTRAAQRDGVTYSAIGRALSSRSGLHVNGNTLSRHVRGGCSCG